MKTTLSFAFLLESFFTERLMRQRQVSSHTIASYRDTFRLLLQFTHKRLKKPPSGLTLEQIDAPLIAAFLDDLERAPPYAAQSESALDGHSVLLSLCRLRGAGAVGPDPTGAGNPGQAVHAYADPVLDPGGSGRAAGGAQPANLGRPPRPCLSADRYTNRIARVGDDQPEKTGGEPARGRAHTLCGQGTQRTLHPLEQTDRGRLKSLVRGARARWYRDRVSQRPRGLLEHGRCAIPCYPSTWRWPAPRVRP